MMKRIIFWLLFVGICVFSWGGEREVSLGGKAAEYYGLLLKNPRPGYLFDRFYSSALEKLDLSDLEQFMKEDRSDSGLLLLAFYYEMQREGGQASEVYEGLLKKKPNWKDVLFYKARLDADGGKYISAIAGLNKLVGLKPNEKLMIKAMTLLGRCYLRSGDQQKGVQTWKKLLDVSGMDEDVAEELFDLQLVDGLYKEALELCEKMLKSTKDPFKVVMLQMRKATIYMRMDKQDEAVKCLQKAFDLAGQGSWLQKDVLSRIEQLYWGQDDFLGLCNFFKEMLRDQANSVLLLKAYANVLINAGEDDLGLKTAQQVVRLVPDSREVKEWYVGVLESQQKFDAAIEVLKGFIERYPDDNDLRVQLAQLYFRAKQPEKTTACVLDFIEHSKKEAADYLQAARLLARLGLNNEATSVYTQLLTAYPKSMSAREAMAQHLAQQGLMMLAWKQYLLLGETCDLDTLLRLSSTLLSLQNTKEAYTLLEQRKKDFDGEYRFQTARFDVARSLGKTNELTEIGLKRIDLAKSSVEWNPAVRGMVYLIGNRGTQDEWIDRLLKDKIQRMGRTWFLVSLYVSQGDFEQAKAFLKAGLAKDPTSEDLLECELFLAKREKNLEEQERILLQLIKQNPSKKVMRIRDLVLVLKNEEKFDEAFKWVNAWKKSSPHSVRPYEVERDLWLVQGRQEEAITVLRKAVVRFNESKELKSSLGKLFEQSGRWIEAEQLYWRMLNQEEDLDARINQLAKIIRLNRDHNQMDSLIDRLERRSEHSPKSIFLLLGLAECYRMNYQKDGEQRRVLGFVKCYRMNYKDEQQRVLNRILEMRPNDVSVLRNIAKMEEDEGNYDRAHDLLLRVVKKDATGRTYLKLLEFEFLYGDIQKAQEMLDKAVVLKDTEKYLNLMKSLIMKGVTKELLPSLRKRMITQPKDYRFAYLYAVALEESGDKTNAVPIFARLMQVTTERPNMSKQAKLQAMKEANRYSYHDLMHIGEGLKNMLIGGSFPQEAYAYNQNDSYYYGAQAMLLKICPDNRNRLVGYSSAHLMKIFSFIPSDLQEKCLKEGGVASLPYVRLLTIKHSLNKFSEEWWKAAFALYPDSKDLHLFQAFSYPSTIKTEKEFRELVATFKKDDKVGIPILVSGIRRFPNLKDLLFERCNAMRCDDKKDVEFLLGVVRQLQRQVKDCPALKEPLLALLENLKTKKNSEDIQLQIMLAEGILKKDLKVLTSTSEKGFRKKLKRMNLQYSRGGGFRYSQINIHRFPPQYFQNLNPNSMFGYNKRFFTPEELKAAILKSDDLLYRIVALGQLDVSDAVIEKDILKLEKTKKKSIDDIFVLITWYADKQPEKALALLLEEKKRRVSDKILNLLLNKQILLLSTLLETIPEPMKPELNLIVKKMSHLYRKMNYSERVALISLMQELGLSVDSLMKKGSFVWKIRRSRIRRSSQKSLCSQVQKLMCEGKNEAAYALVAHELRQASLSFVYIKRQRNSRFPYQLEDALNQFKNENLVNSFLEYIKPKSEGDARGWFEYALACERFNKNEEALNEYLRVQKLRPNWSGVIVRCIPLIVEKDLKGAQKMVKSFSSTQFSQIIEDMQQQVQSSSLDYEQRMNYITFIYNELKRKNEANEMDKDKIFDLLDSLRGIIGFHGWSQGQSKEKAYLPGLFEKTGKGILSPDWKQPEELTGYLQQYFKYDRLKKIQQWRGERYIDLCKFQIKLFSRDAFPCYLSFLKFAEKKYDSNKILDLAEYLLKENPMRFSRIPYYYPDSGREKNALEFYLTTLYDQGRLNDAKKLCAELKEDNETKKELETLLKILLEKDDAKYLSLFKEVWEDQNQDESKQTILLVMHKKMKRKVDVSPCLWKQIQIWNEERKMYRSQKLFNLWLDLELEEGRYDVVSGLLEKYIDQLFTKREERFIKKAKLNSINYNNYYDICQKYNDFAQLLRNRDLSLVDTTDLVKKLTVYDEKISNQKICLQLTRKLAQKEVSIKLLKKMGFLNPFATFKCMVNNSNYKRFVFMEMINLVNGSKRKKLVEEIKKINPQTFGTKMIVLYLEKGQQNQTRLFKGVISLLSKELVELKADPKKQKVWFEYFYYGVERSYSGTEIKMSDFSDSAELELLKLYDAWKIEKGMNDYKMLMNLKMVDAAKNWYRYKNIWNSTTSLMMDKYPQKTMELFKHMLKLKKKMTLIRGGRYNEVDALRSALQFRGNVVSLKQLDFAKKGVEILNTEGAKKWYKSYITDWVYRYYQIHEKKRKEKGSPHKSDRLYPARWSYYSVFEIIPTKSSPAINYSTKSGVSIISAPPAPSTNTFHNSAKKSNKTPHTPKAS